ncbi:MAG: filamentous hemagglutinin N-terminal domain-containing protein, partial [Gammaproteobacteria bacterium]|nr:filamentous hemagglutinin N-terminal domain-containing protein [Gammaproteobacteria bacterium]
MMFWIRPAIIRLICISALAFLGGVHAAPQGGVIVGGHGQIHQQVHITTVQQDSSSLAVNWNSFNINQNEIVNFLQPDTSSIALNRILGNSGSDIHGKINANGRVVLANPNGIFFGENTVINVGGLVASGLDISPTDFMNGNYLFQGLESTEGVVINSGVLNASLGGSISLLGKQVVNNGLISARLGSINLAAGQQTVVTFDDNGLVGVRVNEESLQQTLGLDPAVVNHGELQAGGGRILLTASQSQDLFSRAVNTRGIEQASSVVVHDDGSFTLGGGADVMNTGSIDVTSDTSGDGSARIIVVGENITSSGSILADASQGNAGQIELHAADTLQIVEQGLVSASALQSGQGGDVKILGDKIGLFDQSLVDASGINGGGQVFIGGGLQGLNTTIRNSQFLYLGELSEINANAISEGNGGSIIAFAEDTARIYGQLHTRGGAISGDGGFIETSGKKGLEILSAPDISAVFGGGGSWLIDPNNITILAGNGNTNVNNTDPFVTSEDGASLGVGLILTALMANNADVMITTASAGSNTEDGDITLLTNIDYNGIGTGDSLTLIAP